MFLRIEKFFSGFICLYIIATAAYCTPTINSCKDASVSNSSSLDRITGITYQIIEGLGPANNALGEIGSQFLAPPTSTKNTPGLTEDVNVKSLPAVPAAIFMAISGFMCVSLVRDRRFWLAGFAAMFWVGQMGISNLPRLAQRLAYSNKTTSGELTYTCILDDPSRLRSSLDGTEYIGLLHHLGGIPANKHYHKFNHLFRSHHSGNQQLRLSKHIGVKALKHPVLICVLFEKQRRLNSLFKCLVFNTRHHNLFSPAFIFDSLSRGPPQSALISFHTIGV